MFNRSPAALMLAIAEARASLKRLGQGRFMDLSVPADYPRRFVHKLNGEAYRLFGRGQYSVNRIDPATVRVSRASPVGDV